MSEFLNMIGARIRFIRKTKGYTQEMLAEKTDLQASYISDVERGDRNISLETLERIISALEIKPIEVFQFLDQTDDNKQELLDSIKLLLSGRSHEEIETVHRIIKDILTTFGTKSE
jgi:transcriptional regulator with XRE-family HTH domain